MARDARLPTWALRGRWGRVLYYVLLVLALWFAECVHASLAPRADGPAQSDEE